MHKNCFVFVSLIFTLFTGYSQISELGAPFSFEIDQRNLNEVFPIELAEPNKAQLIQEDAINEAFGRAFRVGQLIQVNLNPQNSGTWTTLSDGRKVWQLRIRAENAMALGLYFSEEVVLPDGGKLYAFNQNKKHVLGAFTSKTPRFEAMQMVEGDVLTLEYNAPPHVLQQPIIKINEVSYFYRGVEDFVNQFNVNTALKAQSCQVDVACTPESNGWAEQIRSVVHFTFNESGFSYVCSGATINNTNNDCKPYILTAWHCGERNAGSSIASWVWYWNYQKSTCQPNSNSQNPSKGNQSITGGNVRSSSGNGTLNNPPGSNQVAGSDFYLVELNNLIPTAYNPYFAGWDRTNTGATSGVGIHHPAGSAKKISTFSSTLTNTNFNGGGSGHFWNVIWVATANGHGVTEGGSSGSPIFNQNKRIVGQLTGGSSFCNATNQPDMYGKLRSDWDLCGNTNTAQLKPWLDPTASGVSFLDGHSCSSGGGGGTYCTASATHSCANGDEFIANVTINSINNTTNCSQYSNFTSQSTTLVRGQQYTVSVRPGIVGSTIAAYIDDQVAVWIDFNDNKTFETSERVGLTTIASGTAVPLLYSFTVPSNAFLGNVRMRVRVNYQPVDGNIEPCGTYEWGETEDYTINIQASGGGVGLDNEQLNSLFIFPNPSTGVFTVDASSLNTVSYQIQVYDLTGALLLSTESNGQQSMPIDLSAFAQGVYNLRFISNDLVISRRIVLK